MASVGKDCMCRYQRMHSGHAGVAAVCLDRPGGRHLRLLRHAQPHDQPRSLVRPQACSLSIPLRLPAANKRLCTMLMLECAVQRGHPQTCGMTIAAQHHPKLHNSIWVSAQYAESVPPHGCSIRKDRRMDYDDSGGEAMKRQSDSYGTSGLLRNFGHVSTRRLPMFTFQHCHMQLRSPCKGCRIRVVAHRPVQPLAPHHMVAAGLVRTHVVKVAKQRRASCQRHRPSCSAASLAVYWLSPVHTLLCRSTESPTHGRTWRSGRRMQPQSCEGVGGV